jgi:hypothetical protein
MIRANEKEVVARGHPTVHFIPDVSERVNPVNGGKRPRKGVWAGGIGFGACKAQK